MEESLIQQNKKSIPPHGEVFLSDKLKPVCQHPQPYAEDYAFTRYILSNEEFNNWQEYMSSLPESIWHDETQVGNVKITRPAHDAWGMQKIVFTFCDDFIMQIFDLPFSRDPKWNSLLQSVYSAIGISQNRIVRSLLARMPSGVQIPVHHDTGFWVKHTHRIHCAIETHEDIHFYVGPTEEKMQEYSFCPGRIVELNNAAKHKVINNMPPGKFRTHLIFDYVDDISILPKRISLNPGEVIHQTRRTIATASQVREYNLLSVSPRFIIIGAQKCGTTSMYEYICQHPLVLKGRRRETHYFDWRFNHQIPLEEVDRHREYYMNFYEREALQTHPSLVTGESTPSYLLHCDVVIKRMKLITPWVKLIIMLREPVARCYSQYQMLIDETGTPEQLKVRGNSKLRGLTFEQVVEMEIADIEAAGIHPNSEFEDFRKVLEALPMSHGGHSLLLRGCYSFQVNQWFQEWGRGNILLLGLSSIQGSKENVMMTMNKIFNFIGLPDLDELEDSSAKNTRSYSPMNDAVKEKLLRFYEPWNSKLKDVLCSDILPWSF